MCEVKEQKKARLLSPGSFFPEDSYREVESFDVTGMDIPENVFAVEFMTARWIEKDGEKFIGRGRSVPGRVYIGGEVFRAADLPDTVDQILRENARVNRWSHLIRCRTGNWQPFTTEDQLASP